MLEPVGPLSPAVYWRRRLVTLVAFVAAVVLLGWIATRLIGGVGASSGSAPTSSSAVSAGSSAETVGNTAASGTVAAPGGGATSSTAPEPTSASATSAMPPPAPALCDASQIEVQAAIASAPVRVGDKPKLVLSVISHAPTDCVRDLNAAGQELLVYGADGARLWSSNDCYPEQSNDVRSLTPGQRVDFAIVWSGKSSSPGCATARKVLGTGNYELEAVQDGVRSPRIPLAIEP